MKLTLAINLLLVQFLLANCLFEARHIKNAPNVDSKWKDIRAECILLKNKDLEQCVNKSLPEQEHTEQ